MSRLKLAICDTDLTYLKRLDEYIRNHINLSFDIHSFTDTKILADFAEKEDVKLLLVSDGNYWKLEEEDSLSKFRNILILEEEVRSSCVCESSAMNGRLIEHVSKFQPASSIVEAVVDMCASVPDEFSELTLQARIGSSRIIGFYTPLSRCGQTTMAIKMGELLSQKGKTILLSFESFSSMCGLIKEEPQEDITDLLYYADCEKDKFCLYLERIKRTENGLDYVAPAKTALELKDVTSDRIGELTELLAKEAGYEYILLDITEYPEGFYEILRMCKEVFMVTRPHPSDRYRLRMFESILDKNGCEDIQGRIVKCQLPDLRDKAQYSGALLQLLIQEGIADGTKA
jgi:hypothetical protein